MFQCRSANEPKNVPLMLHYNVGSHNVWITGLIHVSRIVLVAKYDQCYLPYFLVVEVEQYSSIDEASSHVEQAVLCVQPQDPFQTFQMVKSYKKNETNKTEINILVD